MKKGVFQAFLIRGRRTIPHGLSSMGFDCLHGNALYINLETDTRQETDQLFAKLSAGGKVSTPMQAQFWGAYYGSLTDKFGVNWMFNCHGK